MRPKGDNMGPCLLPENLLELPEHRAIGAELAAVRVAAGVTQQALAARVARPIAWIAAVERGVQLVDVLEAFYIFEALGLEPGQGLRAMSVRISRSKAGLQRGRYSL